jgi:PKD repeat protein
MKKIYPDTFDSPMKNLIFFALLLLANTSFAQILRCSMEVDSLFLHQYQPEIQELIALKKKNKSNSRTESEIYTIPVIFHIIHQGEAIGQGSNLSAAQVYSQLEALNQDFRRKNIDTIRTPPKFKKVATDTQIEFVLARIDPFGVPMREAGINRYNGARISWNRNDFERIIKPITFWTPDEYLNVWVAPLAGILGYAQFPTNSRLREGADWVRFATAKETDGVVIDSRSFGSNRPRPAFNLRAKFSMGRTLTHEIGHFLGLLHISGDGGCEKDDFCEDTPLQSGNSFDCNAGKMTCGNENMVQNFMDYSDDSCMNLFTQEQALRMRTAIENGTRRKELLWSQVAQTPANGIYAWFESDKTEICPNQKIQFEQKSVILGDNINLQSIQWLFPNGNPASSTLPNPIVTYNQLGTYDVILIIRSNVNTDTLVRKNFIKTTFPSPTIDNLQHDFENALSKTGWQFTGTTWQRAATGGFGNSFSCALLRNDASTNREAKLLTPNLNVQNTSILMIIFDYSYVANLQKTDSFAVILSSDCGNTFRTLWKSGGQLLATAENRDNLRNAPKNNEWKSITIHADVRNTNTALVAFVNQNYVGNYLYLDNISISKVNNVSNLPIVDFTVMPTLLLKNEKSIVEENARGIVTKYEWELSGAKQTTSSERVFYNQYENEGNYSVGLRVSNPLGSINMTKSNEVQVISGRKLDNLRKQKISIKTLGIAGFLSGHNSLKDKAKAELFENFGKYEKLYGADVMLGNVEIGQPNATITFAIWDVKNRIPNQVIARKDLPMSIIRQNAIRQLPSRFILDKPIDIPEQFFAGIFLNYTNGEQIAIFTTETSENQNTAYELSENNTWLPYSALVSEKGKNFPSAHAIFPIVTPEIGIFDSDFANRNIKIFPNPTDGQLNIEYHDLEIKSFQLFNTIGQKIIHLSVNQDFSLLSVKNLDTGLYLLLFETDKGKAVKKLVIVR